MAAPSVLRYIAPNLVTSLAMLFGLIAMVSATRGEYVFASWLIVWATFLDRADGVVARLLKATSEFGVQMDSFADFFNFGVAPAFITFTALTTTPGLPTAEGGGRILAIAASALWIFACTFRLARFNVIADEPRYKGLFFGIPTTLAAGMLATVDVVGVLGYDADGAPTWGRSAAFARAGLVAGGFEWGVLGGKLAERWAVGGSAQGDAGPIGLRAEFHVGFPDRDGKGHGDDDLPIYVRAVGGPNVAFAWHNASISAEYMLISDGATKASAYLDRAPEIYVDTVPYLARHYAAAAVGMDVVPILRAAAFGIVNANDGSGLAGLSLAYNVADESDLILGLFVPWGRGLRDVNPMAGTFALGSEFGLSPLLVYLESRVFF
ncbi:MAG: CDP-alcohol phosphatidyltransferase family protein [Myxococcales bacterium]|nr:CDP-alcohol phosphatidyltransferase family protein [Myxococcales bacterium]